MVDWQGWFHILWAAAQLLGLGVSRGAMHTASTSGVGNEGRTSPPPMNTHLQATLALPLKQQRQRVEVCVRPRSPCVGWEGLTRDVRVVQQAQRCQHIWGRRDRQGGSSSSDLLFI